MRALKLPVSVYVHNSSKHRYELSGCFVYSAPVRELPTVLNCSTSMSVLSDNVELLKQAMRAPAIVLIHGTQSKAYTASGEQLDSVPPMVQDDSRIIRTYEMTCMNLTSQLVTYRLRGDGMLVLSGCGEMNCITCYVCQHLTMATLKTQLSLRASALRKTLRDRRLVVALGSERVCVYSLETLLPKASTNTKSFQTSI
jgi:hypothetical protein